MEDKLHENGWRAGLWQVILDFKEVWTVVIFFTADMISGSPSLNPWLVTHLGLTRANPIGIVSAILVYDGWGNVVVLFVLSVAYVLACLNLNRADRRRVSRFFAILVISAAVLGNLVWYILGLFPALPVHGTSGVTIASIGATFVPASMALLVFMRGVFRLKKATQEDRRKWVGQNFVAAFSSFMLSFYGLTVVYFTASSFTGNGVIHFVSFSVAMIISWVYYDKYIHLSTNMPIPLKGREMAGPMEHM